MTRAPIRFFLVAMACAITLPILAFFALLLMQLQQNERTALERRMEREAQSISSTADRLLRDMATALQLVESAPELALGDFAAFHARTKASLSDSNLYVLLISPDGEQLVNTRVPFGEPLGQTGNPQAVRQVLASGKLELSDVFIGRTSGRPVFNVMLPIDGETIPGGAALVMTRDASELATLLPIDGLPTGWTSAIIDGSGNVVASAGVANVEIGKPLPARLRASLRGPGGHAHGEAQGDDTLVGYAQVNNWTWRALVWGPVATAQASILTTWRFLIFGGMALIGLAVASAFFLARRLNRSVVGIAAMADGLARGEIVSPVTSRIEELDMVGKAISNASFDRSQAEDQIRLILRELAHRTKNLLTVAQAIIRQTVRESQSLEEFQKAVDLRLSGLANSIDLLTSERWSGVTMKRLVETHLATFTDDKGRVVTSGDDFPLRPEAVQNLGLAFHELATNAVKYGALSRPGGRIYIEWGWRGPDGEEMLDISWSEKGGPEVAPPSRRGFGSQVIERHTAAAFSAKVDLAFEPCGVRWRMSAPRAAMESDGGQKVLENTL